MVAEVGGIVGEVEEISIASLSAVEVGGAEEEDATDFGVRCCRVGASGVSSEVGVSLSAVSAALAILDEVGVAGVVRVHWEEGELHFFDFLGVGRRGQECESCPTALH